MSARTRPITLVVVVLTLAGLVALVSWQVLRSLAADPSKGQADAGEMPGARLEAVRRSIASLLAESRWREAGGISAAAVQQFPNDRELRLQHAQVLQGQQKWAEAHDQYLAAIDLGPRDPQILHSAGLAASSAGLIDQAISHLSLARELAPNDAPIALHLGLILHKAGRYGEAKASLTVARELDATLAPAWGILAEIALHEGAKELASRYIARARELEPTSVDWRVIEARSLLRDNPQAAADLVSALDPAQLARPDIRAVLRSAMGALGQFEAAAVLLASAADAVPSDADLALEVADLFERAGDTDRAIDYARRASIAGSDAGSRMLARLRDDG